MDLAKLHYIGFSSNIAKSEHEDHSNRNQDAQSYSNNRANSNSSNHTGCSNENKWNWVINNAVQFR